MTKKSTGPTEKICNNYKNTKLKLLKTNSANWFNKMCKIKQLKPKHFSIKINRNNKNLYEIILNFELYYLFLHLTQLCNLARY